MPLHPRGGLSFYWESPNHAQSIQSAHPLLSNQPESQAEWELEMISTASSHQPAHFASHAPGIPGSPSGAFPGPGAHQSQVNQDQSTNHLSPSSATQQHPPPWAPLPATSHPRQVQHESFRIGLDSNYERRARPWRAGELPRQRHLPSRRLILGTAGGLSYSCPIHAYGLR